MRNIKIKQRTATKEKEACTTRIIIIVQHCLITGQRKYPEITNKRTVFHVLYP